MLNEMTNAARSENFDAVREISDGLVEIHLGELAEAAELKTCAEVPVSGSMRRLKLVIVLGGVIALLVQVGIAMATTGATTGYPQPKVVVPSTVSGQFENRYVLTAVGSGAGIRSGEMKFEFEEGSSPEFLVGISQFYVYSPTGEIETALFTFYPFTELPGGKGLKATALKVGAAASYGQVTPDGELRARKPGRRQGERRRSASTATARGRSNSASSARTRAPTGTRRRRSRSPKRNRPTPAGAPTPPNTKANTNSPTGPKTRPRKRARSAP